MNLLFKKLKLIAICSGLALYLSLLIIVDRLDFDIQQLVGYGVMGILGAIVFFGMASLKNKSNPKKFTKNELLKKGLIIGVIGALGFAFADIIYTYIIFPEYFLQYNAYALDIAKVQNNTTLINTLEKQKEIYTSASSIGLSLITGVFKLFMSFIISAMSALVALFTLSKK